ncbi:MAG: cupin domain-containing protein [Bryobacteraceae bacterium]
MTTRQFLAACAALVSSSAAAQRRPLPGAQTDNRRLPRDYTTPEPIQVPPAVLDSADVPWEQVQPGMRRKIYFSDRLTMVTIEFTREKPDAARPAMHYHAHDQMAFVVEGRIRAFIGDQVKELGPGGVYSLPSNVPHGIQVLTQKVVLIDVFTPPRDDMRRA